MSRWVVLAIAVVVGFLLLSYDQRTDDTGVEAGLLIGSSLLMALAAPRVAIAIALAIGLPIAASSFWHGNSAALIALVFSSAGAAIGYAVSRGMRGTKQARA